MIEGSKPVTKNANYTSLWLANSGSVLGDWFNQVALGYYAVDG